MYNTQPVIPGVFYQGGFLPRANQPKTTPWLPNQGLPENTNTNQPWQTHNPENIPRYTQSPLVSLLGGLFSGFGLPRSPITYGNTGGFLSGGTRPITMPTGGNTGYYTPSNNKTDPIAEALKGYNTSYDYSPYMTGALPNLWSSQGLMGLTPQHYGIDMPSWLPSKDTVYGWYQNQGLNAPQNLNAFNIPLGMLKPEDAYHYLAWKDMYNNRWNSPPVIEG